MPRSHAAPGILAVAARIYRRFARLGSVACVLLRTLVMAHHSILTALLWVVVLAIPGIGLWFLGRRHQGGRKHRH